MEKKNNMSILVLLFVACAMIIAIFGGFYLYKIITKKDINRVNNKDITLNEVQILMNRYKYYDNCGINRYIESLEDDSNGNVNQKFAVVLNNVKEDRKFHSCQEAFDSGYLDSQGLTTCKQVAEMGWPELIGGEPYIKSYSYDKLIDVKKELFGSSETLTKDKYYAHGPSKSTAGDYIYSTSKNVFTLIGASAYGQTCGGELLSGAIERYDLDNDKLNVYLKEIEKDVIAHEIDVSTKQYTFKWDNDHYYLVVVKLLGTEIYEIKDAE